MAEDTNQKRPGKEKLSFEQALEKLEAIVTAIEAGEVPLEESIDKYAEGIELVKKCRAILDRAERKIQLLGKGDGDRLEVTGELEEPAEDE
ncbi:MAG TPA: exodeoxyribonuclease VII small subunit [Phycisphaerae bacterium]|nr:exodeoxyribonuclease VII small subunit [Phycisphaerae bacterium]